MLEGEGREEIVSVKERRKIDWRKDWRKGGEGREAKEDVKKWRYKKKRRMEEEPNMEEWEGGGGVRKGGGEGKSRQRRRSRRRRKKMSVNVEQGVKKEGKDDDEMEEGTEGKVFGLATVCN